MERIRKMPYIFGCIAAMTIGIASYAAGVESETIYLRMVVMMLVFFVLSSFAKNTVLSIGKEVRKKMLEMDRVKEQQLNQQAETQKDGAYTYEHQNAQQGRSLEHPGQQQGQQMYTLDLAVGDKDDDFEPLAMSKAVSSKFKE